MSMSNIIQSRSYNLLTFPLSDAYLEHVADGGNYSESGDDVILHNFNNTGNALTLVGGILAVSKSDPSGLKPRTSACLLICHFKLNNHY